MRLSTSGLKFLVRREGRRLEPYTDVAGIWTVGVGHIGPIKIGDVVYPSVGDAVSVLGAEWSITEDYAATLLQLELPNYELAVTRAIRRSTAQHQFDALCSLCFNIGVNAFIGSTALRRHNNEETIGAASAFLLFNKARVQGVLTEIPGLTRRRELEAALYRKGVYE